MYILYMENNSKSFPELGFDPFTLFFDGWTPPVVVERPKEVYYSDLEIACFLAHKRGEYGPGLTIISNDHPLMIQAGITFNNYLTFLGRDAKTVKFPKKG